MAGDLRQQRPGHTLDGKGKAGVLRGTGMTQIGQHLEEFCTLLRSQILHQLIHPHGGITQLGRCGHHPLRFRGVGDQINFQHCNFLLHQL